ncbi:hypothetical protein HW130_02950 [Streptomyces sp. PKU-EA00015]|uniref:hypothetical protein n=1 Tax=Streptomyces sp. PKU-EA00015 TaxID=2748326 RepID=UPI0015A4258E|nr:hypothetical protein [Streptomyces sp. PKU-EA00015]NWF25229.1 hypothetical protein [Streptomyces sp. PKU-EA00015]
MPIPGNFLSETTSTIDPNTSGWTPKFNCTLSRGVGGSATDGCLLVKSFSAGEWQARTVSSYAVTAGQEYEAFADASGATVPERIGIRWLNVWSAEMSITWSMTTATASSAWHRIAVAEVAPEGAAYAQVVFSATTAAANVNQFFDNIYFGLPIHSLGNLLTFDAESHDRASNWPHVAGANCTIARTVPPLTWSPTFYAAGGHTAAMTVTANGDAHFRCTELAPATPGEEYLGACYLNPPTASSVAWVELRFYDASEAQIQATRSELAAPGTGWYSQRASDFAPANAAYASLAFGLTGALAGQVMRMELAHVTVAPELREGTVVPYKDANFEQGVGSWTVVSGAATIARLNPWGTDSLYDYYCLNISSSTATTSVIRSGRYPLGSLTPGRDWTVEAGMKVVSGGWTLTRGIRWYDAANTDLGLTATAAAAVPTPNWWLLNAAHTPPAGATQAAIEYTLTATSASSVLRMDRVALWETLPLDEVVVHAESASTTVTLRELPSADSLTVWRVLVDGSRTLVRGPDGLVDRVDITDTVVVLEDYEAPLETAFYYLSESRNSSGVVTATRTTDTVTIPHEDANVAWLKDPGNPQRNTVVLVKSAPSWQRQIGQAEYRVRGRRNSVTHSDVRGGLEGDLVIWTRTDAERAALHWLLDSGNVLLWQAAPGMGVSDMYVTVGQITEGRITDYAPEQWREWTLPLRQTDMPVTVGVAGSAGRTWQDVLTENATWADVLAKYASWEDVFLNRPK